jgi:DNA primase small subunit
MDFANYNSTAILNKNVNFIRNEFQSYYKKNIVESVIDINKREFGIGDYGKKISARHLNFNSNDDLNYYLRTKTPFFISYSTSYFKYPERRPMSNKEWLGSDIVYEFDSDDFDLPCHDKHNVWVCSNKECNSSGYGNLTICPKCNSNTKITQWTCKDCLGFAKKESLRLIDFLENEFNLDPSTFIISFSGSKGYHIRITDKSIIPLSKSARLQLVDYIKGTNLDLKKLGYYKDKKHWFCPKPDNLKGWSKKIMISIINTVNLDKKELISKFKIGSKKAQTIIDNKEVILNSLYNKFLWSNFNGAFNFWTDVLNKAIKENSFDIDASSSVDVYKIMRAPDTIHGGSGFLSNLIKDVDLLKSFDAFYDPIVLDTKNIKKVRIVQKTPEFKFLDNYYGPYEVGEIIEVNIAQAVFLILKGAGI